MPLFRPLIRSISFRRWFVPEDLFSSERVGEENLLFLGLSAN